MEAQEMGMAPGIEQQAPAEKTLTQAEVNAIVAREKQQAMARGRAEAEKEYQAGMQNQSAQAQGNSQNAGDNRSKDVDVDAIYQKIQEKFNADNARMQSELREQQEQDHYNGVARNYHSKIQAGKAAYKDYDDVTKGFDPSAFSGLVYLLAGMDNAADVLYELSKSPEKIETLDALAKKWPDRALATLQKVSASVAQNVNGDKDAERNATNPPLDQLQPSRISGSNGQMGIRDLRGQDWLRG